MWCKGNWNFINWNYIMIVPFIPFAKEYDFGNAGDDN